MLSCGCLDVYIHDDYNCLWLPQETLDQFQHKANTELIEAL